MGTRNVTAVVLDGQIRVAQYGQWDGYPTGQGKRIVHFLLKEMERPLFDEQVRKCRFISPGRVEARFLEVGGRRMKDLESIGLDTDASEKLRKHYPELSRDTGADILALIQNGKPEPDKPEGTSRLPVTELKDEIDFVRAGLFCEFAYVIDLDNDVLEVYKGFYKTDVPEGERFAHLKRLPGRDWHRDEYSPVHLARKYPFVELNDHKMEQLENELQAEED